VLGRHSHEDQIEQRLAEWTRTLPPSAVAERLVTAGVHAAAVATVPDILADPQLAHRRFWQPLEHPVLGSFPYETAGFVLPATPVQVEHASPCLGEHNEYVFKELLGLAGTEYEALVADHAIW
jgi:crotonobetainyl-CoA:carnitine CoA-transferase CaiB-like acyl-CoA transferase